MGNLLVSNSEAPEVNGEYIDEGIDGNGNRRWLLGTSTYLQYDYAYLAWVIYDANTFAYYHQDYNTPSTGTPLTSNGAAWTGDLGVPTNLTVEEYTGNYIGSEAGSVLTRGLYTFDSTVNGKPFLRGPQHPIDPEFNFFIHWNNVNWQIYDNYDFNVYYTNASTSNTPPLTGWVVSPDGTSPPIVLTRELTGGGSVPTPQPPTITSFTPTSGAAATSVVITGTNFTGATAVAFNGTAASSFVVNSATQITAVVASGTTTGTISVTTSAGTGTSSSSFTFTSGDTTAPTVTSLVIPVEGTYIDVTLNENLAATPTSFTGFSALVGAVSRSFSSVVRQSDTVIRATFSSVVYTGETVTLSYTGTQVEDVAGNNLVDFSNQTVTNNSTQTVPPAGSNTYVVTGAPDSTYDGTYVKTSAVTAQTFIYQKGTGASARYLYRAGTGTTPWVLGSDTTTTSPNPSTQPYYATGTGATTSLIPVLGQYAFTGQGTGPTVSEGTPVLGMYCASNATAPEWNGTYTEDGVHSGKPRYKKDSTHYLLYFTTGSQSFWFFCNDSEFQGNPAYSNESSSNTPPLTGWSGISVSEGACSTVVLKTLTCTVNSTSTANISTLTTRKIKNLVLSSSASLLANITVTRKRRIVPSVAITSTATINTLQRKRRLVPSVAITSTASFTTLVRRKAVTLGITSTSSASFAQLVRRRLFTSNISSTSSASILNLTRKKLISQSISALSTANIPSGLVKKRFITLNNLNITSNAILSTGGTRYLSIGISISGSAFLNNVTRKRQLTSSITSLSTATITNVTRKKLLPTSTSSSASTVSLSNVVKKRQVNLSATSSSSSSLVNVTRKRSVTTAINTVSTIALNLQKANTGVKKLSATGQQWPRNTYSGKLPATGQQWPIWIDRFYAE